MQGSVLLSSYLREKGLSQNDFAALIGAAGPDVHRWCHGRQPRIDKILVIAKVTEGRVPAESWASGRRRSPRRKRAQRKQRETAHTPSLPVHEQ